MYKKISLVGIVLFLLSLNFYGLFFYLTIVLFFLSLLTTNKETSVKLTLEFFLIFIFSSIYLLFYPKDITLFFIIKQFLYPLAYFCGYILVSKYNVRFIEKRIKDYILLIAFGACLHGLLNLLINVRTQGLVFSSRMLPDFWTREAWGATGQATLFTLIIGCSFYGIFTLKWTNNKIEKILIIFGVLIALFYNLLTASRTVFIIFTFVSIVSLIANNFLVVKNGKKHIFITFLSFLVLTFMVYHNNFFGIKSFLDSSALISRISDISQNQSQSSIISNDRAIRQLYILEHFFDYPFGGLHFRSSIGYLHNLWFDVYDMSGIFAFLILVFYFIIIFRKLFYVLKCKKVESEFKMLILGVYLAILLQFLTEPILEGAQWLFILFCFVNGMIGDFHSKVKKFENKSSED